jgi:excisionase family DNA binding protein
MERTTRNSKIDGLLTYQAAAERLGCPVGTVYALVSQQRIPHVRLGRRFIRFDPAALDQWLASQSVAPR